MTLPYATARIENEDAIPGAQRRWHQIAKCVCNGDTQTCPALTVVSA